MKKTILVTGASKGIGLTLAKMLVNKGYKVIGVYNSTLINDNNIDYQKCDIGKEEEINNLFCYVKNKYGKIDGLVNGAALSLDSDFYEKTKEEFMKVLEVNLVGTFLMCKYFSSIINNGTIVNILSTNGINTYTSLSMDYDASKAALINLTKNIAQILPFIKVCGVAPNWVDTETTLSIDKDYLKDELKRINQTKLIKKEDVCNIIINCLENDNIRSGDIIRMDDGNE